MLGWLATGCYHGNMLVDEKPLQMQVPEMRTCVDKADRQAPCSLPQLQAAALGRASKKDVSVEILDDARTRLLMGVDVDDKECWIWRGAKNPKGYGNFTVRGASISAHVASMAVFCGINAADGCVLDHRCRVRACINPAHIRVVTTRANVTENSLSLYAVHASKTHCINGHEFTPENTRLRNRRGRKYPTRECRECNRVRHRQIRLGVYRAATAEHKAAIGRKAAKIRWRQK